MLYLYITEMDKFAAQLQKLQQKVDESEVQKCAAIEKLRKEFMEMKEVIFDAQREYDDTRVILKDITQKLVDCNK